MSSYGPPGGPYPGQPQDPWQGGQPHDPYGQPQPGGPHGQAWGGPPASGGPYGQPQPGYQQPYDQQPYDQQPQYAAPPTQYGPAPGFGGGEPWGPPTPPPRKSRTGLIVALVVVFAVLLCGGGATGLLYFAGKAGDKRASHSPRSTPTAEAPTSAATTQPPTAQPTTAAPADGNDAITAQVGDCLVNDGTNDVPKLRKVTCAKNTFEVLKRFQATVDKTKCEGVPGYTHDYFYNVPEDSEDFVLCLKQRKQ
jgi:hypothetical protein